ncbi:pseudouridine synthase [Synechococcus sp. BL107]|uniref:pseudouridine synthase n=1 Tax=Synechococcus sp. BL107 TaxID=313625 RepID=UPI000682637A|nr:pseudouridine synthase [Synechococcus sp. BL107]
MATLLLHKPYGVLSQFTPEDNSRWDCLRDFVDIPDVYAAGRLDADSEGLLVLTSNGRLQQQLTNPRFGHWRTYWVQVEGSPQPHQLQQLRDGITIQGYRTRPAKAAWLNAEAIPTIGERIPPIRVRAAIPTHWLEISLQEGRNRQVRRMTAAVGLPTLRLIRHTIDLMDGDTPFTLKGLEPGAWRTVTKAEEGRLVQLLKGSNPRKQAGRQRG